MNVKLNHLLNTNIWGHLAWGLPGLCGVGWPVPFLATLHSRFAPCSRLFECIQIGNVSRNGDNCGWTPGPQTQLIGALAIVPTASFLGIYISKQVACENWAFDFFGWQLMLFSLVVMGRSKTRILARVFWKWSEIPIQCLNDANRSAITLFHFMALYLFDYQLTHDSHWCTYQTSLRICLVISMDFNWFQLISSRSTSMRYVMSLSFPIFVTMAYQLKRE